MRPIAVIETKPFNPYSVQFSPFHADRMAISSAANYGIVGNGRLYFLVNNRIRKAYDTQDGLFDLSWSECHENQIVTGGGDGSIKLWDVTLEDYPIQSFQEHTKEVYSVDWNCIEKKLFISASWDLSIKLWSPDRPRSINTWMEHTACIYQAKWCPHVPYILASASGDQHVKIWDTRQAVSVQTIHAHGNEVLALDWNKYNRDQIVTGSVDCSIKTWDIRNQSRPLVELRGHQYAVRNVKCSPHNGNIVASTSYDMTMRVWDLSLGQQIFVHDLHTEFVLNLDFSLFQPGLMATCAWDESAHILQLSM